MRGLVFRDQKRTEEALADLIIALELDPTLTWAAEARDEVQKKKWR